MAVAEDWRDCHAGGAGFPRGVESGQNLHRGTLRRRTKVTSRVPVVTERHVEYAKGIGMTALVPLSKYAVSEISTNVPKRAIGAPTDS